MASTVMSSKAFASNRCDADERIRLRTSSSLGRPGPLITGVIFHFLLMNFETCSSRNSSYEASSGKKQVQNVDRTRCSSSALHFHCSRAVDTHCQPDRHSANPH